jgi:hypothetical protein
MTWKTTNTAKGGNKLYSDAKGILPSLDLRFAEGKNLNDYITGKNLITFSRDTSSGKSAGTYVGSDGLIKNSAVNLVTYSQDFTNSYWEGNSNVTANTDVAPDGNLTASTYSSNGAQLASSFIPITSNTNYTSSIYIKKTTGRTYTAGLTLNYDGGVQYGILLNTNDGTTSPGSFTLPTVAVSSAGNFWRISLTANSGSTVNVRVYLYPNINSSAATATGQQVVWGAQLEEGSTASPYIKTTNLPSAAPRFDHDPTTNASLGLLVEEARTNLLEYSEEIDNNYWGKNAIQPFGSGSVANATTAPDGTETADLIKEDTTTASHFVRKEANLAVASTKYAYSVYVKNIDIDYVTLSFRGAPNNYASATFNLTGSGSLSSSAAAGAGFAVDTTNTKIFDVGNGWFRCVLTFTAGSSVSSQSFFIALSDNGVLNLNGITSYAGTEASLYIWGSQLEAGAFPTSYIPTSGSTVTRAADVASITGTNFSSWYNQSEGSFVADFNANGRTGAGRIVGTNAGATPMYLSADTIIRSFGNVVGASVTVPSVFSTQKAAIGYEVSSQQDTLVVDGGTPNTSTNSGNFAGFAATTTTSIQLFSYPAAPSYTSGTIARLTYFPERLPDATLQAITS